MAIRPYMELMAIRSYTGHMAICPSILMIFDLFYNGWIRFLSIPGSNHHSEAGNPGRKEPPL